MQFASFFDILILNKKYKMSRILLLLLVDFLWVEIVKIDTKKNRARFDIGYKNTYMQKAKIDINKR